jgi:hypothetical protein
VIRGKTDGSSDLLADAASGDMEAFGRFYDDNVHAVLRFFLAPPARTRPPISPPRRLPPPSTRWGGTGPQMGPGGNGCSASPGTSSPGTGGGAGSTPEPERS